MTDIHALIHRMADELDHNRQCLLDDRRLTHPLADKARAELAEPEPELPTDEGLLERQAAGLAARPLLEQVAAIGDCISEQTVGQVRALADRAAAWLAENPPGQPVAIEPRGCPTPGACSCVELPALAEPEPEVLTDEGLLEAVKAGVDSFPPRHPEALNLSVVEYQVELEIRKARAVLARWGNRSAPQPIPVSERLPGPKDCDAEGRCWLGGEQFAPGDPTWILGFPVWAKRFPEIHRYWLPAHALPVPEEAV